MRHAILGPSQDEGSVTAYRKRKYRVTGVNRELIINPVAQTEVLADPAL